MISFKTIDMKIISILFFASIVLVSRINAQTCTITSNPSDNVCGGASISLSVNGPVANVQYSWDFLGDGSEDAKGSSVNFTAPKNFGNGTKIIKVILRADGVQCGEKNFTIKDVPDARITLPGSLVGAKIVNQVISVCNLNQEQFLLSIVNSSSTESTNQKYTINWGDGSPSTVLNSGEFGGKIDHPYTGLGYKTLSLTVLGNNDCENKQDYQYFKGGNPSVTLGTPGNSTGACAPRSFEFPLSGTSNNAPGTIYTINVNKETRLNFTQETVKASFPLTFSSPSCGLTTSTGKYINAYDVEAIASNPCGTSTATVEPIELSGKPSAAIQVIPPKQNCPDAVFRFLDKTTNIAEVLNGNPSTCNTTLPTEWSIFPGQQGVDWRIVSGKLFNSKEIEIAFIKPGNYTVKLFVTSNACGQSIAETAITIQPAPTALAQARYEKNDQCFNEVVSFTNQSTGEGISYVWRVFTTQGKNAWQFINGSDSTSKEPSIKFLQGGNYIVELSVTNVCTTATWRENVNLNGPPTVSFDRISDACQKGTLNFSSNQVRINSGTLPITGINWQFPGSNTASSSDQLPTNIEYPTPGTFIVTLVAKNRCGDSPSFRDTFSVQAPIVLTMPKDTQVCVNSPSFRLKPTPDQGKWKEIPGLSMDGTVTPRLFNQTEPTLDYEYGIGVCKAEGKMKLRVNNLPLVDAGKDTVVCTNTPPITLKGNPTAGNWLIKNGNSLSNAQLEPSKFSPNSYRLYYQYTDPSTQCIGQDSVLYKIAAPSRIQANDTSYCNAPGSVQLPRATPVLGIWKGKGVTADQKFDPQTAGGAGIYTLFYVFKNTDACIDSAAAKIEVSDLKGLSIGADTTLCAINTPFDLKKGANPGNGIWRNDKGVTIPEGLITPANLPVGKNTFSYETGAGNCFQRLNRSIEISPLPQINVAQNPKDVCVSLEQLNLKASPAAGKWTLNQQESLPDSAFFPQKRGVGVYNFQYTYTDSKQCPNQQSINITVRALPKVNANDTAYCDQPGTVTLPFATPINGNWSFNGAPITSFDPQKAGGAGTYKLVYQYTDGFKCPNSDTASITVSAPDLLNAGKDSSVCISVGSFDLKVGASPVGGDWFEKGTLNKITNGIITPKNYPEGSKQLFTYTIGKGNCKVEKDKAVDILALPKIQITPVPSVCNSVDSILLSAQPNKGFWHARSGQLKGNVFYPKRSGAGSFELWYIAENEQKCVDSAKIILQVNPLPQIRVKDTTFCNVPGAVKLPAASPLKGLWKGPGANPDGTFDPQKAGGSGTYTLTYVYQDGLKCVDSAKASITVTDRTIPSAGPDETICFEKKQIQLSGYTPTTGGRWKGHGIVDSLKGILDLSLAGGGTHTYYYRLGAGTCFVEDSKDIRIVDLTKSTAGPLQSACAASSTLQLTGADPANGVWRGQGVIDSVQGIISPQQLGVGPHQIKYIVTDQTSQCSFTAIKEIVVNAMPGSAFQAATEGCVKKAIKLNNLTPNASARLWKFGDSKRDTILSPQHIYQDTGFYTITLISRNNAQCVDSFSQKIYITQPAIPSFAMDTSKGCATLKVNFTNTSQGYKTAYKWDFGNGQNFIGNTPGEIPFAQGQNDTTYIVTLRANNQCDSTAYKDTVTVWPGPIPRFNIRTNTECTPMKVEYVNLSTGKPEKYTWKTGKGSVFFDSIPPTQTYYTDSLPSTYTITLIAQNSCGIDSSSKNITVKPVDVEAFFNVPDRVGCEPFTVKLTNAATRGAKVDWDFGNGDTSIESNPTYTFQKPGTFKVVQKVSNGCGYDSTFLEIIVKPAPRVKLLAPNRACAKESIDLRNLSSSDATGFIWVLANQDTIKATAPRFAFPQTGRQSITLTGFSKLNQCPASDSGFIEILPLPSTRIILGDSSGCKDLKIKFRQKSSPNAKYFSWNFGDQNSSRDTTFEHIYRQDGRFRASLVVWDDNNCKSDTAFATINVFPIPLAAFEIERGKLCGTPVTLAMMHNHPIGYSYNWNIGAKQNIPDRFPVESIIDTGKVNISLKTTNTYGCTATSSQIIKIYPVPKPRFTVKELVCTGVDPEIQNLSTLANQYTWHYSDGTIITGPKPVHTFAKSGTYTIRLVARYDSVCAQEYTYPRPIRVVPSPFASFRYQEIIQAKPDGTFQFFDQSKDAQEYYWEFGDDDFSKEKNPLHRYFSNGDKIVKLRVIGTNQCTDDTTITITPTFLHGLNVPNVLAPDQGEGEQRVFLPKGIGLESYHLQIYSSYGDLIWENTELDKDGSPVKGWDGTKQGAPLPQDTYIWKIRAKYLMKNGEIELKGTLLLLR